MNDWVLELHIDDLRWEGDRDSAKDRIVDFAGAATRAGEFFEIVIRDRADKMIYGVEGSPGLPTVEGAQTLGTQTHIEEEYFPADSHRKNTWMYADYKPGQAPVSRHYNIDEEMHPGRTAGFLGSRVEQLFTALQQRYPDIIQPAEDHER